MKHGVIETLERALSIRQPHIELILRGEKRAEYRSRRTHIRGRVLLYACQSYDSGIKQWPDERVEDLPMGLIVGSVEIVDCVPRVIDGWQGFGWLLAYPARYAKPWVPVGIPQPGFWKPRRV